jgi:hypothetical protein
VVGIASQPFLLSWRDDAGKLISHAPDYFARRADGTSVVVGCRPVERRKPRDAAKFEATARATTRASYNWDAPVDAPASGVAVRRREQSWQPAGHRRCAACASRRH